MLDDAHIGSLVLAIPVGPAMAQRDKADHIVPALARATKPAVLVLTGDDSPVEPFFVEAIQASGVPMFRSADRALRAYAQGGSLWRSAAARHARAARLGRRGAAAARSRAGEWHLRRIPGQALAGAGRPAGAARAAWRTAPTTPCASPTRSATPWC